MPDVTAYYGRSFDFIAIFGYFHTLYWRVFMSKVPILKTNFILNFNDFSTTGPILDLKVSLDGTNQDLKLYLWCSRPLEPIFPNLQEIY